MKRLLMVVSAFFLLGSTANAVVFDFEDHWYEVVTQDTDLTWDTARDNAKKKNGYLVSITSVDENKFVADLLDELKFANYWLGGYQLKKDDTESEGGWAWDSGDTWEELNLWQPGEPNNGMGGTQDYLHFWATNGKWDDMENRDTMKGYVVEYTSNPVPVPPTLVLLGCGLLGFAGVRRRIN
jgi:hypothetical protein